MIDFLGIGAQKCGTTWLYQHLRAHPQVRFPVNKEGHFWDQNLSLGVDWWLDHFRNAPPGVMQGEITPAYATLAPEVLAAIYRTVPEARLFYAIRNPISRAWSSALMALRKSEMTIDEASDQWFVDHFRSRGSRLRGNYLVCLNNWTRAFPKGSMHLIVFDDIQTDPKSVLARLARHLGIDPDFFTSQDEAPLRIPINQSSDIDVRPVLLQTLRDIYALEIKQLGERLQRDLSGWLTWDGRR